MKPHEERVVEELKELQDKLSRLNEFILAKTTFLALPNDEQERLKDQARVMRQYAEILGERIAHFPK